MSKNIESEQMISMFGATDEQEKHGIHTIDIVRAEYLSATKTTWKDLFDGYDELYVITYSSGIDFVSQVVSKFDYAEIIFGHEGVLDSDMATVMALSKQMVESIARHKSAIKLAERIEASQLALYAARDSKSHEKVYCLKSHSGKYRVIVGSANLSATAFMGQQRENIVCFDGENAYSYYYGLFCDYKKECTEEISHSLLGRVANQNDYFDEHPEEIPVLKTIEKKQTIILSPMTEEGAEDVQFIADVKSISSEIKPIMPVFKKQGKLEKAGYGEVEHVAIFDEAQRSWTHKRLADYLKRGGTYGNKLKVPNFPMSEAAFLIWSLDQREDWATIVCLVGGGQEINTGEAGISEWIKAINEKFPHWDVYISPKLTDAEYAEGRVNELLQDNPNVTYLEELHLGVSLRSFRAEKLSAFVHSLLSFDENAAAIYAEIKGRYPIVLTRDMAKARKWLHEKVRGTERTGILVTKESARFKPLAVHILPSGDENAVHWFLEDKADTRSSNYLEDAATEIQVQGLELDYTCLLWDADMRYDNGRWRFYKFNGQTKWVEQTPTTESRQELIKYMLNAYRVLLTRARSGMVICVPEGNGNITPTGFWEDSTRLPEYYDGTYQYLKGLGIEEI